jgi:hypothetical protein
MALGSKLSSLVCKDFTRNPFKLKDLGKFSR